MTTPLLKPAFPPYITPSELALMLDQAAGGGSQWNTATVRATLRVAGALVPYPIGGRGLTKAALAKGRGTPKGNRYATTYDLLQRHLPEIHRALIVAAPSEDMERLLRGVPAHA